MSNSSQLIASVSGIRGVVGSELTAITAMQFARAFGTYLEGQPVAISRDSRPSGEMLYEATAAGLMSVGCNVYFLSINPTPTVGLITRKLEAAGAVQITASHNPSEYNGMKLFHHDGRVLFAVEGEKVLNIYQSGSFRTTKWDTVGKVQTATVDPSREHVRQVLAQVDHSAIAKRHFRVFVDANHGAGGPLALILGAMLGCHVVREGCEPDGFFAHPPEPTEVNVSNVTSQVVEQNCHLGIVLDPDADRLALIDEKGRYIGEELTLGLAAAYRLRQAQGPVVVNMSTSRLIEDLAAIHGCPVYRSPVGEANVVAKMLKVNAILGGEGNGGVIDPRVGQVRDPFIGLAMVLALMTETGSSLSDLVAELPCYFIQKDKYKLSKEKLSLVNDALSAKWQDVRINSEDGLRLDWPDQWIHVRPSNTEPIVRVIAEARTQETARKLCQEVRYVIDQAVKRTKSGSKAVTPPSMAIKKRQKTVTKQRGNSQRKRS